MSISQGLSSEPTRASGATPLPPPRPSAIRRAMYEMPYAHYIIGSCRDGEVNAMVADWVTQVSFNPRLVAVAIENDAYTLESLRHERFFTLSLLPMTRASMELAARMLPPHDGTKLPGRASAARRRIHHKLDQVPYRRTANGCPVLDDALMWLDCEATDFLSAGDHTLVIGQVRNGAVERAGEPLTTAYTGWEYAG